VSARTNRFARALAATALLTALASNASAQTNTGTTIGTFLEIEPIARIAAMGNAGVSAYSGLEGVYYNPASIGSAHDFQALFTHSDWFAGITYDYAAVGLPIAGWGTSYVAITALNSGDIAVRTVDQPLGTGESYSVNDLAIGLGFGRQVSPRFSAGGQVTFAEETIWHTSATMVTASIGTLYRVSENGLRIGSSLSNFGTRAAYGGQDLDFSYDNVPGQNGDNNELPGVRATDSFSVPVDFRVGVGMPFKLNDEQQLLVEADAYHPNDNAESMSLGAEYTLARMVSLRGGFQNLFLPDAEGGTTLGAGLVGRVDTYHYQVDYAWADAGRLGHTQRLTVGFRF